MLFDNTMPTTSDNTASLWKKINQVLSAANGGEHPPGRWDWKHDSIYKVALLLFDL